MSTAYTPEQRKQLAHAFKAARKHLPSARFLCNSLDQAALENPSAEEACTLAKAEVMRRIKPRYTVGQWLRSKDIITFAQQGDTEGVMLKYRTRWLDSLIAEFSTP